MDTQIATLVDTIKEDYASQTSRRGTHTLTDVNIRMIEEFDNRIEIRPGRKYIKIVSNGSVWGFIVATDNDNKFRKGDILKAAGYNAPARNHARGNILDGNYSIHWTGPHYM